MPKKECKYCKSIYIPIGEERYCSVKCKEKGKIKSIIPKNDKTQLLFDFCYENRNEKISKRSYAIIKILSNYYNTTNLYYSHLLEFRNLIYSMIWNNNYSPMEIARELNINYTDFGMFIKGSLQIKLKNLSQAVNNYRIKTNTNKTDKKEIYLKKCQFKFNPYDYPQIPGYNKLLKYGVYNPTTNPNGACRDHMISREYGWRNNIDPSIISSVYNCQYLTNKENIIKGSSCSLTIENLLKRIESNNFIPINSIAIKRLPKSKSHRKKLSEASKKYMSITDGFVNKKILKSDIIPYGYIRGMTKRKRK